MTPPDPSWPPYAFVPGGEFPHPTSSPRGHSFGVHHAPVPPIAVEPNAWTHSPLYLRGLALFNAGYYWEAHEAWESLWHAHKRQGPVADLLKALIKLAAAGVKVRERQAHGVTTHARRAAEILESLGRTPLLGLDPPSLARLARSIADHPPRDPGDRNALVTIVFPFELIPSTAQA